MAHGFDKGWQHETAANYGANVRAFYLTTKLLWQPGAVDPTWSVNPQLCLADFYQKAFGPASSVMQQYYERLDAAGQGWILTEDAMAQSYSNLATATTLAGSDSNIVARLDQVKQYLHSRYLWVAVQSRSGEQCGPEGLGREDPDALLSHPEELRHILQHDWLWAGGRICGTIQRRDAVLYQPGGAILCLRNQ